MAPASRQTERSRQTDLKVAESSAAAVRRDGFDQLALTRVAADAGYSSGVIYARCDDRSELMVLAWEKSFWPSLSAVLDSAFAAMVNRDPRALDAALDLWSERTSPSSVPDIGSAVEVIVAARRDEVLSEVVHADITALLEKHGAGPGSSGPVRELLVLTASTLLGTALLNSAMPDDTEIRIDPRPLLHLFISGDPATEPAVAAQEDPPTAETVSTGDEVRDALIRATEYVIARSGVHRATVSRIARRAGISVGAIYGLYENKETLVLDCVSVVHQPQARRDLAAWLRLGDDIRSAMSLSVCQALSPENDQWRAFRIEYLVAARHSPALARLVEEFNVDTIEGANASVPGGLLRGIPARGTIIGLAVMATVDPSISRLGWNWFPIG